MESSADSPNPSISNQSSRRYPPQSQPRTRQKVKEPKPPPRKKHFFNFCCDIRIKIIFLCFAELIFGVFILVLHILSLADAHILLSLKGNELYAFDSYRAFGPGQLDSVKIYSGTSIGLICIYLLLSGILLFAAIKLMKLLTQFWMVLSAILYIIYAVILGLYHPRITTAFVVILLLFFTFKLYHYIVVALLLLDEEVEDFKKRPHVTGVTMMAVDYGDGYQGRAIVVESTTLNSDEPRTGGHDYEGQEGYRNDPYKMTRSGERVYHPYYPGRNSIGQSTYPTIITIKKFVRKLSKEDTKGKAKEGDDLKNDQSKTQTIRSDKEPKNKASGVIPDAKIEDAEMPTKEVPPKEDRDYLD